MRGFWKRIFLVAEDDVAGELRSKFDDDWRAGNLLGRNDEGAVDDKLLIGDGTLSDLSLAGCHVKDWLNDVLKNCVDYGLWSRVEVDRKANDSE